MTWVIFSHDRFQCPPAELYQAFPDLKQGRKPFHWQKPLEWGWGEVGGRGCSWEDREWVSSVGNRHPCRELVLWGVLRSQTCNKNQRNTTVSDRFKQTTWRTTTGGRPWGSKQPFCKAWLSTMLLRIELFVNVSVQRLWIKIKLWP